MMIIHSQSYEHIKHKKGLHLYYIRKTTNIQRKRKGAVILNCTPKVFCPTFGSQFIHSNPPFCIRPD